MSDFEKLSLGIIKDYHSKYSLADIQLESYNHFVTDTIRKIVQDRSDIVINSTYKLSIKDIFLDYPCVVEEDRAIHPLYPMEARTRDLTYEGLLSVNIIETIDGVTKFYFKVPLAKIPIMVGSCRCNLAKLSDIEKVRKGECENDPGGYFIINGKERVIVAQERINYNETYIYSQQKHSHSKYSYVAEIRSMSDETGHSTLVECAMDLFKNIIFNIPYIKNELPYYIVFRVLGVDNDELEQLVTHGLNNDTKSRILSILDIGSKTITCEEAIEYMSKHTVHAVEQSRACAYVSQIIERELFPHLGSCTHLYKIVLAEMVRKLLLVSLKIRKPDDRDNISNKRLEATDVLIGDIFRSLYKKFIKTLEAHLVRRPDALAKIPLCAPTITQGILYCFSTGNWSTQHTSSYVRTGVCQIMSRLSYIATVSQLRKTVIPVGKETKNVKIRQIHPSTFGFIDPVETPEGQFAGITKSISFLTKITKSIPTSNICDILNKHRLIGVNDISDVLVSLNGKPLCYITDALAFVNMIKSLKSSNALPMELSIVHNPTVNEVCIYSDSGRLMRAVFTSKVKDIVSVNASYDFDTLVEMNVIKYIDTIEAEYSVISSDLEQDADYYEIHPFNMFGICSGSICFSDHSQAPRNIYSTNMMKQSIGTYALNSNLRSDTITHLLCYPQKQLVTTIASRYTKHRSMPSGVNTIVAIACLNGYNQEDSVIVNKSAIERGLFRSIAFRTIIVEESRRNIKMVSSIKLPDPSIRRQYYNYSKLDSDGIVMTNIFVDEKDVIVGKVNTKIGKTKAEEEDVSVVVKSGESGFVDKVFVTTSPDGYKLVKVKIRSLRVPEMGDKVASTEGQKSTIGLLMNQEDMPFLMQTGMVPDLILNPCCLISRMTINQMMETVLGKSSLMSGCDSPDATPFTSSSVDVAAKLCDMLQSVGFKRDCTEIMISGTTGEQFIAEIFCGPTYYQRLKHLVADKIHSRSYGPIQQLSRQPMAGRSRDGGMRLGEMERDGLISHAGSAFLQERLFKMSDFYQVNVCNKCGDFGKLKECVLCDNTDMRLVNIPYACKLLFHNLMACGIRCRINTRDELEII